MIHSYKCKNFYSIGEEIEVRFDVTTNAPKSAAYAKDGDQTVSLVEAIVGPNASGKTNVIKGLAFFRYLISEDSNKPDENISITTFAHKSDDPSEVSVTFTLDSRLFTYMFVLNSERILNEKLSEKSKSKERTTSKTLFFREWDHKTNQYKINDYVFGIPSTMRLRKNKAAVYNAVDYSELAAQIVSYWRDSVLSNVYEGGNHDDLHKHSEYLTKDAIKFFYMNPRLKDVVSSILKKLDVGFADFEREVLEIEKTVLYRVKHRYKGKDEFSIPLQYESSGTKRAVLMLRYIIQAIESRSGGLVALDELDAYLHPDIVESLVKLFLSKETNPNGAQLLFSSHSHQLLAEFDKQQITLVEKNEFGETEVWRLDEMQGVRADENYYTKYIAGAYGAKPKIG